MKGEIPFQPPAAGFVMLVAVVSDCRRLALVSLGRDSVRERTAPDDREECERELPFDQHYLARGDELMRLRYRDYWADANEWRRIDIDWLSAATDLYLGRLISAAFAIK